MPYFVVTEKLSVGTAKDCALPALGTIKRISEHFGDTDAHLMLQRPQIYLRWRTGMPRGPMGQIMANLKL